MQDLFRSVVELALLPPADPSDDAAGTEDMYLDDETWYGDSSFGQQGGEAAPAGNDWGWGAAAKDAQSGSWDEGSSSKDAEPAPGW